AAEVSDPLAAELARRRHDLEQARARLLDQLRQLQEVKGTEKQMTGEWTSLTAEREQLQQAQVAVSRVAVAGRQAGENATVTMTELRERSKRLAEEMQA